MSKEYNDRHLKPLRAAYREPAPGTSNHNAEYPRLDVTPENPFRYVGGDVWHRR